MSNNNVDIKDNYVDSSDPYVGFLKILCQLDGTNWVWKRLSVEFLIKQVNM